MDDDKTSSFPDGTESGLKKDEHSVPSALESVKDYVIFIMDVEGVIKTWHAGGQLPDGHTNLSLRFPWIILFEAFSHRVSFSNAFRANRPAMCRARHCAPSAR